MLFNSIAILLTSLCGMGVAQQVVTLPLHPDPVFRPVPSPMNAKQLGADTTATTYLLVPAGGATPSGEAAKFWSSVTITVIRTSTVRYHQALTTTSTLVVSPGWTSYFMVTWSADASCTAATCSGFNSRKETAVVVSGGRTFTIEAFPAGMAWPTRVQPSNVPVTVTAVAGAPPKRRDDGGGAREVDGAVVAPRVTAEPWRA